MRYLILLCNPFPQQWCLPKTTISGSVHFQALSFGFSRKPSNPPVSDKFSVVTVEISFPVGLFVYLLSNTPRTLFPSLLFFFFQSFWLDSTHRYGLYTWCYWIWVLISLFSCNLSPSYVVVTNNGYLHLFSPCWSIWFCLFEDVLSSLDLGSSINHKNPEFCNSIFILKQLSSFWCFQAVLIYDTHLWTKEEYFIFCLAYTIFYITWIVIIFILIYT